MIEDAINNGEKGTSINMANGNLCSVYCYPGYTNRYVVIETHSRSLVQASDFYDDLWIPDTRIIWHP